MASKGELTAQRILDCAEPLFARKGYDACSLRDIAGAAGIREPGVYNYFANKEALFDAVLTRALHPMAEILEAHLQAPDAQKLAELPALMIDLFHQHPHAAAFFNQALTGDDQSPGTRLNKAWLKRLLRLGRHIDALEYEHGADTAIRIIALFNLCSGYFLAQRAFDALGAGNTLDAENIARHKALLQKLLPAMV